MNIKRTNTSPIQKALKLPATNPERIFKEAPPVLEEETISLTCFDFVLVNILVNSGIKAAPNVPQLITVERTIQRLFGRCPINNALTIKVTIMEIIEVIHTNEVRGTSKSIS